MYKNNRPLTEEETNFLFKRYNDVIISYCLVPEPNNLQGDTLDNSQSEDIRTAIARAAADGKLTEDMPKIEQIRIVTKYTNTICYYCKEFFAKFLCSCKAARYCNRECQKADWCNHKKVCMAKSKKNKS